jgi:hypothetical protein
MNEKEIDYEDTCNIVCPICGYVDEDSCYYHLKDGETIKIDCDCGATFTATYSVDGYSTQLK